MSLLRSSLFLCCFTAALSAQHQLPPAPGKLFDIGGGRRLHLLCSGQGSPTVLFESGAAAFSIDFTIVQAEIAKSHHVCSYDRAGSGWSDPLPKDALADDAADLHGLLAAANETGPFVLVGASRGGLLIRSFLATHPGDVAGLVFVDPATEDRLYAMVGGKPMAISEMTAEQMRSTLPSRTVRIPKRPVQTGAPFDALPPELYKQRLILDERLIDALPDTLTPEQLGRIQEHERAFLAGLLATRKSGTPFGDRPTIVLSRGDERDKGREDVHAALAKLSTNSRHTVIDGSGHEIHLFQPRAVVNAINDVLEAVAKKSHLRPE